jgi:gliding motility-associated-like protein
MKQKSNGCDSLVLQQLIVKPGAQTLETLSFCKGDTLKVYDQLFIQAGGQICKTAPGANGCDSTHCVQVTAYDPPMIASPDTIYGQILQNINLQGAAGYQQYHWTPVVPNCANCPAVNVQFDTAGFYEYTLIIGDGNQCVDTVVYRIVVFPPCNPKNVRIPNAFTPNGDGLNETFKVVDREGSEVVGGIAIYDRWGEKVYASQNKLFWDGTIDGKPAPSDVYVYIIEIICAGTPEKLVGDVTLLR